jgi:CheY-like chemotaxis protein
MFEDKKKINILVVDDDQEIRDVLRSLLIDKKFSVDEACNGKQALAKIAQDMPDIIILDIVMPQMCGIETSRRLRENPQTKNIPIIFCTGKQIEEIKQHKTDIDEYLNKPFRFDEFYEKVHKVLKYISRDYC